MTGYIYNFSHALQNYFTLQTIVNPEILENIEIGLEHSLVSSVSTQKKLGNVDQRLWKSSILLGFFYWFK